jgi:hypothetical protein
LESKTRTALWSVDRTDRDVMRDLWNYSSCTYRSLGSHMPYKQDRDREGSCMAEPMDMEVRDASYQRRWPEISKDRRRLLGQHKTGDDLTKVVVVATLDFATTVMVSLKQVRQRFVNGEEIRRCARRLRRNDGDLNLLLSLTYVRVAYKINMVFFSVLPALA